MVLYMLAEYVLDANHTLANSHNAIITDFFVG